MAYICTKKIKCTACPHYKYDADKGRNICFADREPELMPKEVFKERTFWVPVVYEMYGRVPVEARSVKEAFEKALATIDDLPLPSSAEYIDGSFDVDVEGIAFDSEGKRYDADTFDS